MPRSFSTYCPGRAAKEARKHHDGPDADAAYHLGGGFETLHLVGPAGTEQRFVAPLMVDGAHDVEIDDVSGGSEVPRVEWSRYVAVDGGPVSGLEQPWHRFPVTVPAHHVIRLGMVVRKPADCSTGLSHPVSTVVTVRWHALDDRHTTELELDYGGDPPYACG